MESQITMNDKINKMDGLCKLNLNCQSGPLQEIQGGLTEITKCREDVQRLNDELVAKLDTLNTLSDSEADAIRDDFKKAEDRLEETVSKYWAMYLTFMSGLRSMET